jgi:phosphoglycolate phosphatase
MEVSSMRAIIFDFDGVIADTYEVNYQVDCLRYPGFTRKEFDDLHNGNVFESHAVVRSNRTVKKINWAKEVSYRLTEDHFFDVADVIKELSTQYTLFVVSSNKEKILRGFLKLKKLDICFKAIIGEESHRSKSEKFKMIFAKYKLKPNECVYITDTVGDILEARSVGIDSIAVGWGFQSVAKLKKAKPLKLVSTPHALKKYFL